MHCYSQPNVWSILFKMEYQHFQKCFLYAIAVVPKNLSLIITINGENYTKYLGPVIVTKVL
jgi:hypothetical protein